MTSYVRVTLAPKGRMSMIGYDVEYPAAAPGTGYDSVLDKVGLTVHDGYDICAIYLNQEQLRELIGNLIVHVKEWPNAAEAGCTNNSGS